MKLVFIEKQKNKQSLSFLYKVLVFMLIFFMLDFATGSLLKYYYFKQTSGFYYRTTYAIEKTKADVLVFGSSKANHQYCPDVFVKGLNLSFYNVGRDGSSIFYHYAILKSVLQRYSPKVIILDITREFEKKQSSYDRLNILFPYYESHLSIRPIIDLKSPSERFKLISKIYPYNSLIFSILSGNSDFNKTKNLDIDGYVPLSNIWSEPIQHYSVPFSEKLDSTKIKIYESFIQDCLNSRVKLYIVASPNFYTIDYVDKTNLIGKEIALKYKIKFIDHSKDSLFLNNGRYFADNMHLNNSGAIVFSNMIVDEIVNDYSFKEVK
jgi:hypothetical protein